MKNFVKGRWHTLELSIVILLIFLLVLILYLNWLIGVMATIVALAVYGGNYKTIYHRRRLAIESFDSMAHGVTQASNFALQNLPVAIAVVNQDGVIGWSNSVFRDWIRADWDKPQNISTVLSHLRMDKVWGKSGFMKEHVDGRYYGVVYKYLEAKDSCSVDNRDVEHMAFYLSDITATEVARLQAEEARPVSGMIQIDNLEDVTKGSSDKEFTNLWAQINNLIVEEIDQYDGFVRSISDDAYIFSFSREALRQAEEKKFQLLDKIRAIPTARQIPVTISVGISVDAESIKATAEKARAALDLALGRGGDQVCINEGGQNRFFGGKTTSAEKNTRVRARVVAQALQELLEESNRILVMGHQREDYDAIGASLGVLFMARTLNKDVRLVLSHHQENIYKLVNSLDVDLRDYIITPEQAKLFTTHDTLVVVCDVHRPGLVADPESLAKSKRRVVIDHHRRASDFIEDTLLTYLEPAASSTSELVTELIEYFGSNKPVGKDTASGLYAGIVLDTKNFTIQTGARTFEAAAFLRRAGANLDLVKELFRDSLGEVQARAKMLYNAHVEGGIAITEAPDSLGQEATLVSAQAADLLIQTEGIEGAFVLYHLPDGSIGISARSQGKLNVQLVMEAIGGGGHRTVAGAQVAHMTTEELEKTIRQVAIEQLQEEE